MVNTACGCADGAGQCRSAEYLLIRCHVEGDQTAARCRHQRHCGLSAGTTTAVRHRLLDRCTSEMVAWLRNTSSMLAHIIGPCLAEHDPIACFSQHEANVVVVEMTLEAEVWRRRLELRAEVQEESCKHKPASWEQLQSLVNGYSGCDEWPEDAQPRYYLALDATLGSTSTLQSQTVQYLSQQGLL